MTKGGSGWLAGVLILALLGASGCSPSDEGTTSTSGETTMLIEPNVAVGKVRQGMKVEDVIAAIGEPAKRTSDSLRYPQLGMAVIPGPDGKAEIVMCGDVMGPRGPYTKAFRGRTKEGIGMGSTREQVVAAFGDPTETEGFRNRIESLKYAQHGITFTLDRGKVYHMIVRLRSGVEVPAQTQSITIDLTPPAAAEPAGTK